MPSQKALPSGSEEQETGTPMKYVGVGDLVARWVYSRQGVHKLSRSTSFPAPCFTVNRGRTRIWRLSEIEVFERQHPEVTSEAAKYRKTTGYYRAILKG
jgi:hypothetical protein